MKIKSDGKEFKSFEVKVNEITWQKRCELNDLMVESSKNGVPNFSFWGKVVLDCTGLSEEELNKYSTSEIISIANAIFEEANKKK